MSTSSNKMRFFTKHDLKTPKDELQSILNAKNNTEQSTFYRGNIGPERPSNPQTRDPLFIRQDQLSNRDITLSDTAQDAVKMMLT